MEITKVWRKSLKKKKEGEGCARLASLDTKIYKKKKKKKTVTIKIVW